MSSKVKESTIVYPANDSTPKASLWLSSLDLIPRSPYTHTHLLFVYEPKNNQAQQYNNCIHSLTTTTPFLDSELLKDALSKVLVPFYPMAGRLKSTQDGRLEIECNAKGVLFIEAETTHVLDDFGEFNPSSDLRKVVFPTYDYENDYSGRLSAFPLLMVQLTRFKCGGVTLGFDHHHHVADGASCAHLINSWARIARGLDLSVVPFHDRATCFASRHPPQVKFRHVEYEPPLPPSPPRNISGEVPTVTESHFKISKEQIHILKLQARSQRATSYKLSTFVVLAAHVWRVVCKARGLKDEQDVKLYIPVDGRSRLKDDLPLGYYGNVIFFTACVSKVCDIKHKPLWDVASMVHTIVKKMNNTEYLRSAIDYLESQPDLTSFIRGFHTFTCPNFLIDSWLTLPFNEADFGWGQPKFVRHGGIQYEGQSYIIPSQNGDGSVSVAIKLFTPHMSLFEKYLYDFYNPIVTRL